MDKCLFFIFFGLFFSCKKELKTHSNTIIAFKTEAKTIKHQDAIAYFENALVYQYQQNGEKEEFWIYVNEKEKQLLFVPNDDMIQAVISYSDGTYKIFGTNEHGKKTVFKHIISSVLNEGIQKEVLKKLNQVKVISQKNIQQKDIFCEGFRLDYIKMEGGETLYATTQIPINSFQLYGFSNLNGDCKLPVNLDFTNVFKKSQLITHIERGNFKLELLNYGPNPYEFNLKEYIEN